MWKKGQNNGLKWYNYCQRFMVDKIGNESIAYETTTREYLKIKEPL